MNNKSEHKQESLKILDFTYLSVPGRIIIFILMMVVISSSIGFVNAESSSNVNVYLKGTLDYDFANQILDVVNKERDNNGLSPLTMDSEIVNSANIRAKECILKYTHSRPVDAKWSALLPSGYTWAGENLGIGYNDAHSVVKAWMESPKHRKNILNSNFNSIGIGVFKYEHPIEEKTVYTFAQLFSNKFTDKSEGAGSISDVFPVNIDTDVYPLKYNIYYKGRKNPEKIDVNLKETVSPQVLVKANDIWGFKNIAAQANTLEWKTGNSDIVEITSDSGIKGLKTGQTTVQAFTSDHKYEKTMEVLVKKPIYSLKFSYVKPQKYTGEEIKPKVIITDGGTNLSEGKDYKVTYSDNIYTGDSRINIAGIGDYGGSHTIYFSIYDESTNVKESWWKKFLKFIGLA